MEIFFKKVTFYRSSSNFDTSFSLKLGTNTATPDVTQVQSDIKNSLTSAKITPPTGVNSVNVNPSLTVTIANSAHTIQTSFALLLICLSVMIGRLY
jgi:hypothetical protein